MATFIGIGLVLLLLGFAAWTIWTADPRIERSVIGMAGLPLAVDEVRVVERPVPLSDMPLLRIVPLYDNDLGTSENDWSLSRDLRQELRVLSPNALASKIARAPTLVVLTKWRRGALAQSVFHPTYLVDPETVRVPFAGPAIRVQQAEPVFDTFRPVGRFASPVTLYAAQTIAIPSGHRTCTPVVWRGGARFEAVLLARCTHRGTPFHVLSDPDLLNNHGLGLGRNVLFARALVKALAATGTTPPVRADLDLTDGEAYRSPRVSRPDRSFADLARFLGGSFLPFWLALALLTALGLWRGGVRFGRAEMETISFVDASRSAMIGADARLLRASGAVQPLLAAHANERLDALARRVFGRTAASETFLQALARRAPSKARHLRALLAEATPSARSLQPKPWLARFDRALGDAAKEFDL